MVTARHRKGPLSQRAAIAEVVYARVSTLNQWRSEGKCIGDSCLHGRPKRRRRRARTTWVNFKCPSHYNAWCICWQTRVVG